MLLQSISHNTLLSAKNMADEGGELSGQNATQNIEGNSAEQNKKIIDAIRNYQATYDKSYPEFDNISAIC